MSNGIRIQYPIFFQLVMEFEFTTHQFCNWNGIGIFTFKFGPQILIQRPKKIRNSEFHRQFLIRSVFRNFGSHIESEILSFVLLTINLQLVT